MLQYQFPYSGTDTQRLQGRRFTDRAQLGVRPVKRRPFAFLGVSRYSGG